MLLNFAMYFQCRKCNFRKAEVKVAGGVFSRTNDHLKMEINKKSGRKGLQRLNTSAGHLKQKCRQKTSNLSLVRPKRVKSLNNNQNYLTAPKKNSSDVAELY